MSISEVIKRIPNVIRWSIPQSFDEQPAKPKLSENRIKDGLYPPYPLTRRSQV